VSHTFGGGDAANASGVDLDVTESGVVDHVFGLMKVVATFAPGHFDSSAFASQGVVGLQSTGDEGFLEPNGVAIVQGVQALFGETYVVAPDGAGIDQEQAVRAQTFARSVDMIGVLLDGAAAVGTPTKLGGAIVRSCDGLGLAQGGLGIVAEQLGSV